MIMPLKTPSKPSPNKISPHGTYTDYKSLEEYEDCTTHDCEVIQRLSEAYRQLSKEKVIP